MAFGILERTRSKDISTRLSLHLSGWALSELLCLELMCVRCS